ncbi:MAG: ATPase, T2SS/T4P/T4SS family [Planctomycetota bacterium]
MKICATSSTAMRLYDAHNHLQDDRLVPCREAVLAAVRRENVVKMVVNGSCEADWPAVLDLARRHPQVIPSFGYHPWYVKERSADWRQVLLRHLDAAPSAVGEVGLDRWVKDYDLEQQQEVFVWQLRLAAERNLPQEGRILLKVHDKDVTLLASILPTFQGEYAVLRVAPAGITITLPQIFSDEAELQKVRKLIAQPHGVVICSGPAGSGKSLLAFAMLQEPEFSKENVLSIEDPVCVPVPGVKQVEVAPQRGLTFPRAIEAAMRQDPDVLLIGEVRDLETAQAAIQAALSGHLVIAVMNAATPLAVVRTLREMGVAPFQMSAAVIGIISQRLVQKLCPNCRTWAASPTKGVPPEVAEFLRQHRQAEIYVSKGCANCGGSGYKGRVSIHSILVPDDGFRDAVAASADAAILLAAARKAGMKSLLTSGLEKVVAGLTSVEKAWQVAWDDR